MNCIGPIILQTKFYVQPLTATQCFQWDNFRCLTTLFGLFALNFVALYSATFHQTWNVFYSIFQQFHIGFHSCIFFTLHGTCSKRLKCEVLVIHLRDNFDTILNKCRKNLLIAVINIMEGLKLHTVYALKHKLKNIVTSKGNTCVP